MAGMDAGWKMMERSHKLARAIIIRHFGFPERFTEWQEERYGQLERDIAAHLKTARLQAFQEVKEVCEIVARGTVKAMADGDHSDTWKIIAQNSVEQYESLIRAIDTLEKPSDVART